MKHFSTIIILFITFVTGHTQEHKTIYHLYERTASISRIIEWNIEDWKSHRFVVKETIDKENRVLGIQFLVDGEIKANNPMYGAYNIRFEYTDNYIVEKYLDSEGRLWSFLEDETPSLRKYELNEKNEIINCSTFFHIVFTELSKNTLKDIERQLKFWREHVIVDNNEVKEKNHETCDMNFIYGYLFSYTKMNGVFPKIPGFTFDFDKFEMIYSEEILKGLKEKYEP